MSANYERLKQLVESIEGDIQKAEKGNKAATTRVRKHMQDVKRCCQDIRQEMMELRDISKPGS